MSQTGVSLVVEAGVGDGEGQQEGPDVPVLPGQQGVHPHHPARGEQQDREHTSPGPVAVSGGEGGDVLGAGVALPAQQAIDAVLWVTSSTVLI